MIACHSFGTLVQLQLFLNYYGQTNNIQCVCARTRVHGSLRWTGVPSLPHARHSQKRLRIHHNPVRDKALNESE